MNITPTKLLSLLLACSFAAFGNTSYLRAQSTEQEKTEKEVAKRKELEKQSLNLLDEVIGDAGSLRLPENRSYILTNAADLLWPHDEKRARALFWEALGNFNLAPYAEGNLPTIKNTSDSSKTTPANGPTKEQLEEVNKYYARINTRREFLQKVARHDPELALDMMRSTRQGPPPNVPGTVRIDPDVSLEQELTFAAAANDPKRALPVARESLAKGLTYEVLKLLQEINGKDQDAGTQLAGDIIAKLKTENLGAANSYAPFMAGSLLASARTGGAVLFATHELESVPVTRLKLSDDQKQDLVYLLTDAALTATGGRNALQTTQWVMPEIEQYAPDRVATLKARLAEYNRTLPADQRNWNNFNARFEKATPEEMIRAANSVTEDQRGPLFYQAASRAVEHGEADKYRELVHSQIEDETQRKMALDSLNDEQLSYDISHGRTDDLEKLLPLIRVKEQQAMATAELAMMLQKKDQHDEAVKLLDQAWQLVKVNLTDNAQSNALLAVMLASALVDPPKAFAMIEPIVDRANDEISKLFLLDKIVKTGAFKNGEIILNQPQIPLDYSILKYSAGVVALGTADFNRTKALADRFQRNELRVTARLMLAQSLLRAGQRTTTRADQ